MAERNSETKAKSAAEHPPERNTEAPARPHPPVDIPAPASGAASYPAALDLVMDAGQTLLENGGEVFRVQDTMEIMAKSLGVQDFNVYVLTNGIFASAQKGRLSEVRHIPAVNVHLARVEAINTISRRLAAGELSFPAAEQAVAAARSLSPGNPNTELWASVVGSGCFAFLFGGGAPEVAVAALAGVAEQLVGRALNRCGVSRMLRDIAAAACVTAVAVLARQLLPALNPNTAIIGALMALVPGVALTMGVRDIINGDYLSGAIRLLSALLIAGSLACGVVLAWLAAQSLGVLA